MKSVVTLLLLPLFTALTSCSTPKAVTEQANLGVSMMAELEDALQAYRKQQARSERYLTATATEAHLMVQEQQEILTNQQLSLQAVGEPKALEVRKRLLADRQAREEYRKSRLTSTELEERTKKLLLPISSTTGASTEAQAALAGLTQELPTNLRVAETRALISAVQASLKDAKKTIDDAEVKALAGASN